MNFYNCIASGFTEAGVQIGGNNTGANVGRHYAYNAIVNLWSGGDMQGNPHYGIAVYAGGIALEIPASRTGSRLRPAMTFIAKHHNKDVKWTTSAQKVASLSGQRGPQGQLHDRPVRALAKSRFRHLAYWLLISGTNVGGDGKFYKTTVDHQAFGGITTPVTATSGSATTIVNSGARWTDNAFVGNAGNSILAGTGQGHYGIITANTATTITVGAGWNTNYAKLPACKSRQHQWICGGTQLGDSVFQWESNVGRA